LAILKDMRRHTGVMLAVGFLSLIIIVAALADFLPLQPFTQKLARALEGPSVAALFGTDELGRDILSRVIYGARTSLMTAGAAVVIAVSIGVPIGLVAGFFGGWRDAVLMRLVD